MAWIDELTRCNSNPIAPVQKLDQYYWLILTKLLSQEIRLYYYPLNSKYVECIRRRERMIRMCGWQTSTIKRCAICESSINLLVDELWNVLWTLKVLHMFIWYDIWYLINHLDYFIDLSEISNDPTMESSQINCIKYSHILSSITNKSRRPYPEEPSSLDSFH